MNIGGVLMLAFIGSLAQSAEAQAVGANTRAATADLAALRAEVEASLRKVAHLVDEINRKWPFARDTQLKLP